MADVLVVFGSSSDRETYAQILKGLEKEKISFEFRILSAHKTPEELKEAIEQSNAKIIIAGAGLSAALPGIIASYTIKPVIGVPCKAALDGLDAFLSILQMPPGVPVLTVGLGREKEVVKQIQNYLMGYKKVILVKRNTSQPIMKAFNRCKEILDLFKIKSDIINSYNYSGEKELFIDFVPLNELSLISKTTSTAVLVPVAEKDSAKNAITLAEACKSHFWVGLNNPENAALGAIELLNSKNKFDDKLMEYREKRRKKVLEADSKERR